MERTFLHFLSHDAPLDTYWVCLFELFFLILFHYDNKKLIGKMSNSSLVSDDVCGNIWCMCLETCRAKQQWHWGQMLQYLWPCKVMTSCDAEHFRATPVCKTTVHSWVYNPQFRCVLAEKYLWTQFLSDHVTGLTYAGQRERECWPLAD